MFSSSKNIFIVSQKNNFCSKRCIFIYDKETGISEMSCLEDENYNNNKTIEEKRITKAKDYFYDNI